MRLSQRLAVKHSGWHVGKALCRSILVDVLVIKFLVCKEKHFKNQKDNTYKLTVKMIHMPKTIDRKYRSSIR